MSTAGEFTPIRLADRRISTNGAAGFEFDCGICGAQVFTSIRHDHFPSCMCCRAFCILSRDPPKPLADMTIRNIKRHQGRS